ncbi:MAG: F0F1 ATP synthase subunit delta [Pseudomonadota bacterium]|nr:F0F1 ATP synthase subunit delta [Pseudomonadota bacterium]
MATNTAVSIIANRYATALFELADDQSRLDEVAADLTRLVSSIDESQDLQRLVRSPILNRKDQGKAMTSVLEAMEVGELTKNFVGLIAQNRRLFALTDMVKGFLDELARRRGEVTAEVTAARSLSESQVAALQESLQRSLGGKVSISHEVDPTLIGGMVVKVGSRMVDTSLRTQLNKIQIAMKGVS